MVEVQRRFQDDSAGIGCCRQRAWQIPNHHQLHGRIGRISDADRVANAEAEAVGHGNRCRTSRDGCRQRLDGLGTVILRVDVRVVTAGRVRLVRGGPERDSREGADAARLGPARSRGIAKHDEIVRRKHAVVVHHGNFGASLCCDREVSRIGCGRAVEASGDDRHVLGI